MINDLFTSNASTTLVPVRQLIHHRREPTPRYTLRVSSLSTSPRKRSLADNQRADLFIVGIDFQVLRCACPRQLHYVHVGLDGMLPDYLFLNHAFPDHTFLWH